MSSELYVSTKDFGESNDLLVEVHGRIFSKKREEYLLPSDQVEWERLDKQHAAIVAGFGGLVPCPELADTILENVDGVVPKRILDVGCGTGTWAIQAAKRYPHAQVIGLDVSPIPLNPALYPDNLSYEVHDVNVGMNKYHDQYDLVHSRCIAGGIKDMARTINEFERCLKPGGLLVVIDGDIRLVGEDRKTMVKMIRLDGDEDLSGVGPDGSWLRRILHESTQAALIAGSRHDIGTDSVDIGPWDHELCDSEWTANGGILLPIGPWAKGSTSEENRILEEAGTLMREAFLKIHRAYHPILLKHGVDQASLDEWSQNIDEEVGNTRLKMWIRYMFFWTRRREDTITATKSSDLTLGTDTTGAPVVGSRRSQARRDMIYPAFEVNFSQEETMAAVERRKSAMGVFPKSAVARAWDKMQKVDS